MLPVIYPGSAYYFVYGVLWSKSVENLFLEIFTARLNSGDYKKQESLLIFLTELKLPGIFLSKKSCKGTLPIRFAL